MVFCYANRYIMCRCSEVSISRSCIWSTENSRGGIDLDAVSAMMKKRLRLELTCDGIVAKCFASTAKCFAIGGWVG